MRFVFTMLALSGANAPALPKGEPRAWPQRFLPLPLTDFPRPGEDGEAKKGNKVDLRSKDGEGEVADLLQQSLFLLCSPHFFQFFEIHA